MKIKTTTTNDDDDDKNHHHQHYKMGTTYSEAKIEIINNAMMASNHFHKKTEKARTNDL